MITGRIAIVAAALIIGFATVSFAKYQSGFTVMNVVDKVVTIQKAENDPIEIQVNKNKFKVGDKVKYDAEKNKIKKSQKVKLEGC